MEFVITFPSSHQAMHADKIFSKSEIKCEIIPTPREISSECGFSLLGEIEDILILQEFSTKNKIKFNKIYIKKGKLYEEN
jgi:hypothetical protein